MQRRNLEIQQARQGGSNPDASSIHERDMTSDELMAGNHELRAFLLANPIAKQIAVGSKMEFEHYEAGPDAHRKRKEKQKQRRPDGSRNSAADVDRRHRPSQGQDQEQKQGKGKGKRFGTYG